MMTMVIIILTRRHHFWVVITTNYIGLLCWPIFGNNFYMSFVTRSRRWWRSGRRWIICRPIWVEEIVVEFRRIIFRNCWKVSELFSEIGLKIMFHNYVSWLWWFLRLILLLRSIIFIAARPLSCRLWELFTIWIRIYT